MLVTQTVPAARVLIPCRVFGLISKKCRLDHVICHRKWTTKPFPYEMDLSVGSHTSLFVYMLGNRVGRYCTSMKRCSCSNYCFVFSIAQRHVTDPSITKGILLFVSEYIYPVAICVWNSLTCLLKSWCLYCSSCGFLFRIGSFVLDRYLLHLFTWVSVQVPPLNDWWISLKARRLTF